MRVWPRVLPGLGDPARGKRAVRVLVVAPGLPTSSTCHCAHAWMHSRDAAAAALLRPPSPAPSRTRASSSSRNRTKCRSGRHQHACGGCSRRWGAADRWLTAGDAVARVTRRGRDECRIDVRRCPTPTRAEAGTGRVVPAFLHSQPRTTKWWRRKAEARRWAAVWVHASRAMGSRARACSGVRGGAWVVSCAQRSNANVAAYQYRQTARPADWQGGV